MPKIVHNRWLSDNLAPRMINVTILLQGNGHRGDGHNHSHNTALNTDGDTSTRRAPTTASSRALRDIRVVRTGNCFIQRGQVNSFRRNGGCEAGVETSNDENALSTSTDSTQVSRGGERYILVRVERTIEDASQVGLKTTTFRYVRVLISSSVGHEAEHVRYGLVHVITAEIFELPVGLDCADRRVVGVIGVIGGALLVGGDGATKEDGKDTILGAVAFVFVERQEHERTIVVEVGVVEERTQPPLGPVGEEGSTRICPFKNQLRYHTHT